MLRETRLRALRDTPLAFGSNHARESALTDQQWIEKTQQWTAPGQAMTLLALDAGQVAGIVGCFTRIEQPGQVAVVSMWVAPHYRRQGLAHRLLAEVELWAIRQGAAELVLDEEPQLHVPNRAAGCFWDAPIRGAEKRLGRDLRSDRGADGKSRVCAGRWERPPRREDAGHTAKGVHSAPLG